MSFPDVDWKKQLIVCCRNDAIAVEVEVEVAAEGSCWVWSCGYVYWYAG